MSDNQEMEVIETSAVVAMTTQGTDIDVQIATAHWYPRSITQFQRQALAMATVSEDVAASCFYKLPRGGKEIEGPGVRLAEIIASSWGNLRFGSRITEETPEFIVAQGMCHDLQNNVATTIEVRRRITDKYGKKFNADMIGVTANAACAIALRNAIFKIIPKSFVDVVYDAAKKVAVGDASTLNSRRTAAIAYFAKLGVSEAQILTCLGKAGINDIDLDDMEALTGMKTAIKEGTTTVDSVFPPIPKPGDSDPTKSKTENLAAKIGAKS